MKITIECDDFFATTENSETAIQLLQMAGVIDCENTTHIELVPDHFADASKMIKTVEKPTISKMETVISKIETTDATNASLPPFNPVWAEREIDLNKYYIQQYSNPCSTLHGNCGGECVQTELWLRSKKSGKLSVCDVEFTTLDELRATLEPYVKLATRANAHAASKKLPCSRERLEQLAKVFNTGKSDAEIMEQYHISASSVATYRAAAKRCGLLNN